MAETIHELKRQLDITKTQHENLKFESEKEISDLRDRHKTEMQDLVVENQTLQTKLDDKRDREVIRQLRRDLDDYKRRSNDLLSETSELRKERD